MYICVKFENTESEETKNSIYTLGGIPNGTCLTYPVFSTDIYEVFGNSFGIWFVNTPNIESIYTLSIIAKYPGVKSVTVLPFNEPHPTYGTPDFDSLRDKVLAYLSRSN